MDGPAAVQHRIASIQSRFGAGPAAAAPAPVRAMSSTPLPLTAGALAPGSFDATLAAVLGDPSLLGAALGAPAGTVGSVGALGSLGALRGLGVTAPRAPGAHGRLQPPAELLAFGNGRIPIEVLSPIGAGSHRLWGPAAASFRQLLDAAAHDGVTIGVTDSYRDLRAQEDLAARKGLYREGGLAATPGTSNHGWGLSVDLDLDDRALAWMRANGARFGFVEDVPREPWHWTYRPAG